MKVWRAEGVGGGTEREEGGKGGEGGGSLPAPVQPDLPDHGTRVILRGHASDALTCFVSEDR